MSHQANILKLAWLGGRPRCRNQAHVYASESVKLVVAFNEFYAARRWLSLFAIFAGSSVLLRLASSCAFVRSSAADGGLWRPRRPSCGVAVLELGLTSNKRT